MGNKKKKLHCFPFRGSKDDMCADVRVCDVRGASMCARTIAQWGEQYAIEAKPRLCFFFVPSFLALLWSI